MSYRTDFYVQMQWKWNMKVLGIRGSPSNSLGLSSVIHLKWNSSISTWHEQVKSILNYDIKLMKISPSSSFSLLEPLNSVSEIRFCYVVYLNTELHFRYQNRLGNGKIFQTWEETNKSKKNKKTKTDKLGDFLTKVKYQP